VSNSVRQVCVCFRTLSFERNHHRGSFSTPRRREVVVIGSASECGDLLLMSNPRNNLSSFHVVPCRPCDVMVQLELPWIVTIRNRGICLTARCVRRSVNRLSKRSPWNDEHPLKTKRSVKFHWQDRSKIFRIKYESWNNLRRCLSFSFVFFHFLFWRRNLCE